MLPWNEEPQEYKPPKLTSVYQPSGLRDGVLVPGLQATITGVVSGLAALALTAWFDLPHWAIGGTVAAVAMCGAWLSYRSRWQWLLERITGADLNGDGFIGKPLPQLEPRALPPLRVELIENDGRTCEYIDLPYPDKLSQLATGLQEGRTFALSTWTGSGALFSRAEFEELREELIKRKLAEWVNPEAPAQGVKLTPSGRAIFRKLATTPPSRGGETRA